MSISSVAKRFSPPIVSLSIRHSSQLLGESLPRRLTLLLRSCSDPTLLRQGKQVHAFLIASRISGESYIDERILGMYAMCGSFSDCGKMFHRLDLPRGSTRPWNSIITSFVRVGLMNQALSFYFKMVMFGVSPDVSTFPCLVKACVALKNLRGVEFLKDTVSRRGMECNEFVASSLIKAYLEYERSMPRGGDLDSVVKWFSAMRMDEISPNVVTFDCVLSVCASKSLIDLGVQLHGLAFVSGFEFEGSIKNSLLSMYSKCGSLMMRNGLMEESLVCFSEMVSSRVLPDAITFSSLLPSVSRFESLEHSLKLGRELHGFIIKNGFDKRCNVGSAVIDMYAKCGRMDLAHEILGDSPRRILFHGSFGDRFDCVSISSVLSACASVSSQSFGKAIHCFMIKRCSLASDVYSESTLIGMYAKCGNLESAMNVFERMEEKNIVSWNTIIAAYGNHGRLKDSLRLFREMVEDNGVRPDQITFLEIISSSCHAGDVDQGVRFFRSMTDDYGIQPQQEHYACLVDLFGRAGRLKEAYETVKGMPFAPDGGVWGTLLGACRLHKNVELAKVASRRLMDLDPGNSGYYVLISNAHADAGEWGGVTKARSIMKERGVEKVPGTSWIEINKTNHSFVSGDENHRDYSHMHSLLNLLLEELKLEGYVSQPYLPMHPHSSRKLNPAEKGMVDANNV
ncbi:hypothetical protein HID58_041301 [Brassica napus]|uniref:Pentatricopeptide repeat-containing protein n=1 Tax=Brassica napus TaxID=3708 RepID=A0ABQ8BAQ1_BRANA|nr:hypothetical protein HID58_041301 [Brassica napus]